MVKNKKNIIIGIVILIINLYWIGQFVYLFYGYHFTKILWFYMYPDWLLIFNMIVGLIGALIGINLIINKIGLKKALVIDIPTIILGLLISSIYPMFG